MSAPRYFVRQQICLIESALPPLSPMQRHRHNSIEAFLARQRQSQQASQRLRQRLHASVLEKMQQRPQLAFIESVRVGRIKTAYTAAAQRAPSLLIQRKSIAERRPALRAKVIRRERLGLCQAGRANRNPRNLPQWLGTDPAVVRKDQGKKANTKLTAKGRRGVRRESLNEQTTAEDDTP